MDVSGNPKIYVMFGFEAFIVKCAELGHACRSGEHCHVGHYMEPLARLCMCACNVAYIIMHLACVYVCVCGVNAVRLHHACMAHPSAARRTESSIFHVDNVHHQHDHHYHHHHHHHITNIIISLYHQRLPT